jgi:hypothetical protein
MMHRFGRDNVAFAFAVADHICRRWHDSRQHDAAFRDRMLAFHGPGWQAPAASPTAAAAAIYPQAVALTRLLASPYWKAMSAPGNPDGRETFITEMRRTVAPGYPWPQPPGPANPLETWINKRYISGSSPGLFNYHNWQWQTSQAPDAKRRAGSRLLHIHSRQIPHNRRTGTVRDEKALVLGLCGLTGPQGTKGYFFRSRFASCGGGDGADPGRHHEQGHQ